MSDTNVFINAYIDNTIGMIHENISTILQLKTQIKITNDTLSQKDAIISDLTNNVVSQKDTIISDLTNQIEQLKNGTLEISQLRQELQSSIEANHALTNKVSHMDSLLNQINQMKTMVHERDTKIQELNAVIEKKDNETVLNTKSKKITKVYPQEDISSTPLKVETKDDF